MQRRIQRNAARNAERRTKIKSEGPQPGDIVVGCIHGPDPRMGAHCFYIGTDTGTPALKISFRGKPTMAKWIFLCHECNDAHGKDITAALEQKKVQLRFVHTWTKEDGTLNILPVTFEKNDEQGNDDDKDESGD